MGAALNLSNASLFRFAQPLPVAELAKASKLVTKSRGEAVLLKGELALGIYLVLAGEVAIYVDGVDAPISVLGEGEALGERTALQGRPSGTTVRVYSEKCELALLPRQAIMTLMMNNETFATAVYQGIGDTLAKRLKTSNDRLSELATRGQTILADLPTAKELYDRTRASYQEQQQGAKVNHSLVTGVIDVLQNLATEAPQHRQVLLGIAQDLSVLRENEQMYLSAYTRLQASTLEILKALEPKSKQAKS